MLRLNYFAMMTASFLLIASGCGESTGGNDAAVATDSGSDTGSDATADADTNEDAGLDAGSDAGEDAGVDSGAPGSTTLTPSSGGSAEIPLAGDDEASVSVPAGAVSQQTPIVVNEANPEMLPVLEGADASVVSQPVAFTPHGTAFTMPITISFRIDGGVPAGAVIVRLDDPDDSAWELIDSTVAGDVISAVVNGFSIYAVATGTVCDQADPDSDGDGICDSIDPCAAPSEDTDGNGVCDDAEARIRGTVTESGTGAILAGVEVTLYDDLQNLEGTSTTDSGGNYAFGNLTADSYTASVQDSENCRFGSGVATVALGETQTIDIVAGCF